MDQILTHDEAKRLLQAEMNERETLTTLGEIQRVTSTVRIAVEMGSGQRIAMHARLLEKNDRSREALVGSVMGFMELSYEHPVLIEQPSWKKNPTKLPG